MNRIAAVRPSGRVRMTKLFRYPEGAPSWRMIFRHAFPHPGLEREVFVWRMKNLPNFWRGFWRVAIAKILGIPCHYGVLYLTHIDGLTGQHRQLGMASMRVVTTAGINALRDQFLGTFTLANLKYHGFGTGTTAEAVGDTALVTELTTEYASDSTRPTGSQASNGAGDYRTVATLSPDSGGTLAITEHGVFSATSAGTLLDRSKFSADNLVAANGDSLQATYDLVFTAGG